MIIIIKKNIKELYQWFFIIIDKITIYSNCYLVVDNCLIVTDCVN